MLTPTPLPGLFEIDLPSHGDGRGRFSRVFCRRTFEGWGLEPPADQWSLSSNAARGTLRGLHYQAPPHAEVKLVRCVRGAVFDAVVDLRAASPTFGRRHCVELSASNRKALYVPRGLAHGFLTLEDDCELLYAIAPDYEPAAARGLRWNDPTAAIPWPMEPRVLSPRDAALPFWPPSEFLDEPME